MKKFILIWISFVFMFFSPYVMAVEVFERSENNLRIPDKVKYNDSMLDDILSTPSVDASKKVYDFCDYFTSDEEERLYQEISSFIRSTGLDMAVVTTDYHGKVDTGTYADDFYDYNDFKLNGLIFVIDMYNREYYISTSGSALLYYDDSRIDTMLDSLYYNMKSGNYYGASEMFVEKALDNYNLGLSGNADKYEITGNGVVVRKTPYLVLIIISLVVAGIVTLIMALRNKPVKLRDDASMYVDKSKVNYTRREDNFITSNTTKVYIPPSDSGSGSSSGGGSFHSGSSGISHGGGGRGF